MATVRPAGAALSLAQLIATVDSATSEATGYRKSRLLDPRRAIRWRSTGVTEQVLSGELESGALPTMLGLVDPNFATPAGDVEEALALLDIWLRAPDIAQSDNTAIASWASAGIDTTAFAQGTAGNRPTYQTNEIDSKAVVRLDGSDDYLDRGADYNLGTSHAIFGLIKPSSFGFLGNALLNSASSGLTFNSSGELTYAITGATVSWAGFSTGTTYIIAIVRSGTSISLYRNGALVSTQTLAANNAFTVRNVGASLLSFAGDIGELAFSTNAALIASAGRIAIQDHLRATWAATTVLGSLLLEIADNSGFTTNPRRWALRTPTRGEPNVGALYLGAADNGVAAVAPTHWRLTIPAGCTIDNDADGVPQTFIQLGLPWLGTYRELVISPVDNEVENPSSVSEAADGTEYIDSYPGREVVPVECELLTFSEATDLKEALREVGTGPVIYDQHAPFEDEDVRAGAVYYGRIDTRRGIEHTKRGPTENAIGFTVVEQSG